MLHVSLSLSLLHTHTQKSYIYQHSLMVSVGVRILGVRVLGLDTFMTTGVQQLWYIITYIYIYIYIAPKKHEALQHTKRAVVGLLAERARESTDAL